MTLRAWILGVVLLATGCGSSFFPAPKPGTGGGGNAGAGGAAGSGGAGGGQGGGGAVGVTPRQRALSMPLGGHAQGFAKATPYSKLIVEIDWVSGGGDARKPSPEALARVKTVLTGLIDKPGGITMLIDDAVDVHDTRWTVGDIRAVEETHRDHFSDGDTAAVWFLYTDGEYEQSGVWGIAYGGSSLAVFIEPIRNAFGIAGTKPFLDTAEATVALHELGHAFGLVNIGAPMQTPHEEAHPDRKGHDSSDRCIMYWAVEQTQFIINSIIAGESMDFDANCRADIAALKQ